jgi:hypothetical protein
MQNLKHKKFTQVNILVKLGYIEVQYKELAAVRGVARDF